jgi:hypothetical protein
MEFINSLFGRSSTSTGPQTSSAEKRLLELDPPREREPLFESDSSTKSAASHQPQGYPSEALRQPSPRQNKAPVIFAAGLAFTALSLLITRRSFARRRIGKKPSFYTNTPAHAQAQAGNVSGAVEALEALNIATLNVASFAMLTTGGALWYFDIGSMEDARRKLRGGLGVDGSGRTEGEAEEDFEEWLATVLNRKEAKERRREYEGEKEERRRNERGRER